MFGQAAPQYLTATVRVWPARASLGLLGCRMDVFRECVLLPFLFVLATELWAIKILDRTGITGIQVSCAITGLWNGAACVSLVLRNRPSFGCERLSAQGQATRSEREKKTQQSSK